MKNPPGVSNSRPVRRFERVDSTNDIALTWLHDSAPDGAVVIADEQANGRGRLGRAWYAPAGTSLLMTYVFHANPAAAHRASMLGALAAAETCEQMGARDVGIKYPNDVQINSLKVCGVLAEAATRGDRTGIALGIGLNLTVNFAGTPLEGLATGLCDAVGRTIDREAALTVLLDRLDHWRGQFESDALFAAWKARLNMLGSRIQVVNGAETVTGMALDVDSRGFLHIQTNDGHTREVIAGDLLVLR